MKNIKRLLSMLLVLSITMSLIIVPNTAYADLGDNDYLVADFTKNDSAISSLKFTKDTEVCYEDDKQSAKWLTSGKFKSTGSGIYYLDGAAGRTVDLSAMVSLHIIMNNAENVGNELNIVFRNAASTQGYFQKKIALDWTGWKEIIIPLSEFGKKIFHGMKFRKFNSTMQGGVQHLKLTLLYILTVFGLRESQFLKQ